MIIVVCVGTLIIVGAQIRESEHYFFFSDKWHIPQRVAEVEERHRLEDLRRDLPNLLDERVWVLELQLFLVHLLP